MKKIPAVAVGLVLLLTLAGPAAAQTSTGATLAAPPAIYLPAGGKVVTEVNLSDDDVLGIIKQAIPAIAEVVKDVAPQAAGAGKDVQAIAAMAGAVDMQGLSEAIQGVKNVRLVAVRYPSEISPERFVEQFSAGAAKAGPFNKILSDFGMFPGAVAIYALPGNAGCMGFVYIPAQRAAYALRVVGGVDVPKLIKWAGGIAKVAVGSRKVVVTEPQAVQPSPQEPPAGLEEATPSAPAASN